MYQEALVQGHTNHSTWLNRGQQSFNDWHKLSDKRDLVSGQHKNRKLVARKILLKLEILVGGYKDIEAFFGPTQQLAILDSCPSHLLNS